MLTHADPESLVEFLFSLVCAPRVKAQSSLTDLSRQLRAPTALTDHRTPACSGRESRRWPVSDVHSHMKMLNIRHLAGIVARLGCSVEWDAKAEQIVGDEQANAMLARPYRSGYEIDM